MSAEHLAHLFVWLAAPPQTMFVIVYGLRTRWWKTATGRAIFTKGLSVALLLDLSLVGYEVGPYPGDIWVAVGVIGLVLAGAWMQLGALLHEQFADGHPRGGFGNH